MKSNMLIGNEKLIEKLEECIKQKKPVVIHGDPGIGKTLSVYYVAKKLGYIVHEVNASDSRKKEDLEKLKILVISKPFLPTIFLIDEADGVSAQKTLYSVARNAQGKNPLVMTANEYYKFSAEIKRFQELKFKPPKKKEIIDFIHENLKNLDGDFSKISDDIRNSIIAMKYGSEKYSMENIFEIVKKIFLGEEVDYNNLDRSIFVWLIDNAHNFFYGKDLYEFYQKLAEIDLSKKLEFLAHIKSSKVGSYVRYPYFYKRLKVVKDGHNR